MKTYDYRVYFHGDFVGIVKDAMTPDEAVLKFARKHPEYARSGLMALETR